MNPVDPAVWEKECLAEVRQALASAGPAMDAIEVHGVRLEGEHPDSKLIVDLTSWGVKRRMVYELWGPDFEAFPGQRESPYHVGGIVYVHVIEEGRAPRRSARLKD